MTIAQTKAARRALKLRRHEGRKSVEALARRVQKRNTKAKAMERRLAAAKKPTQKK